MSCTGAGLVGVVLTAVLPTTLEDLLAVGLAALGGYVALLNLPLRRGEAKAKLERVATNFSKVTATGLNGVSELHTSLYVGTQGQD